MSEKKVRKGIYDAIFYKKMGSRRQNKAEYNLKASA